MTSKQEIEALAEQWHSTAIQLLRSLRKVDVASGLNGPRLSALSVIVYAGPISMSALARAEQVQAPTMTRLVAALEDLGLVTRQPAEQDRRSTVITATYRGHQLMKAGKKRRIATLTDSLTSLSREECATVREALLIIQSVVSKR